MSHSPLERIYDTYAAGLFHYLSGFTRTEADARDLLQEVFIRLARGATPDSAEREKAFLYRLAHNLAIDWLRRRQARWTWESRLVASAEDEAAPDSQDEALLTRRFAEALQSLPPEQRSVVELKLWDDLTFEEIAHAQEIPLNTACSRYRYGLEKMRSCLQPLYEELQ